MGKAAFYLALSVLASVGYLRCHVLAEDSTVVPDDDDTSEEAGDHITIPAFVRSKFNLRIWSTTEALITENQTETTKAPMVTKATKTTAKTKRTRTTTLATTTIQPTTEVVTLAYSDNLMALENTSPPTNNQPTTMKPKQRKLSSPGCGELNGDDIPWIAILEHTDPKGDTRKKTLSKGVLIDDRHVLTTISSIHNSYPFWLVTGVRLGDTPTWAFSEGGKKANARKRDVLSTPIRNVFLHEKKDIAVIRLAERVNFTEKIRPVCLPVSDRFNYTELFFHVCRKEKSEFGRTNTTGKLVAVTSLTQKDCQILFRRHQAEMGPKEFCAWDETGDNCTGDLGGPLMVKLSGRYHVVGLNSYALAKSKIDSEGLPGVYVRVGSFLKWIQAVLKTEFDDSG
ncbi:CLIP domain-containing serine protease B4-like [Topomyia yanbarensis]|uniref:CLIP domain-containing serine protease B4-like n=1 Tax=Topomyia yanbarensis TaxID=2498891 RepID=UPI00273B232A|nr:CLIP domain-containing serine protease B4-like [Topomyia yanbarensis]